MGVLKILRKFKQISYQRIGRGVEEEVEPIFYCIRKVSFYLELICIFHIQQGEAFYIW